MRRLSKASKLSGLISLWMTQVPLDLDSGHARRGKPLRSAPQEDLVTEATGSLVAVQESPTSAASSKPATSSDSCETCLSKQVYSCLRQRLKRFVYLHRHSRSDVKSNRWNKSSHRARLAYFLHVLIRRPTALALSMTANSDEETVARNSQRPDPPSSTGTVQLEDQACRCRSATLIPVIQPSVRNLTSARDSCEQLLHAGTQRVYFCRNPRWSCQSHHSTDVVRTRDSTRLEMRSGRCKTSRPSRR